MVQFCCVVGCGNRSNIEYRRFYRLPFVPKRLDKSSAKAELLRKRRKQWLDNIARVDLKDGDGSYSSGYIRICSDHFFAGKPSELTDVGNIDWAPTLKMGKSRIRLKGNNVKKETFGFSASARRRNKKVTKWIENNSLIQTIIPSTSKTDDSEMEERRILALEAEIVESKKYYKCKKNPWQNRRKNIGAQKKSVEIKDNDLGRKTNIYKDRKAQSWQREQESTFQFSKRSRVKKSEIRKMQDQNRHDYKGERFATAIGCSEDDPFLGTLKLVQLNGSAIITSSTTSSSKSPIIHKITIDTVNKVEHQASNNLNYDTSMESAVECDNLLYDDIKSESDRWFENRYRTLSSTNDNIIHPEHDVHSENLYNVQINNACNIQFEYELDTESKEEYDESASISWCVVPSAEESELILEMMNEQCPILKEEIKEEPT